MTFESRQVSSEVPNIEFTLPQVESFTEATQVSIFGAFCASGTPILTDSTVDVSSTRCPKTTEAPLLATVDVTVSTDGEMNHNPSFKGDELSFDGKPWAIDEVEDSTHSDCAGEKSPILKIPAKPFEHQLKLEVPRTWSEPLKQLTVHSSSREALQVSHLVTLGELERAYSLIDGISSTSTVTVGWKAKEPTVKQATRVWFYFVVRDGRGGVDWARRSICLIP
jgi:hypothetical protein